MRLKKQYLAAAVTLGIMNWTTVALKDGQIVGAGKPKDLLTEKFIKDLYEVDTKIEALPNDNINIRFLPKHFK